MKGLTENISAETERGKESTDGTAKEATGTVAINLLDGNCLKFIYICCITFCFLCLKVFNLMTNQPTIDR